MLQSRLEIGGGGGLWDRIVLVAISAANGLRCIQISFVAEADDNGILPSQRQYFCDGGCQYLKDRVGRIAEIEIGIIECVGPVFPFKINPDSLSRVELVLNACPDRTGPCQTNLGIVPTRSEAWDRDPDRAI